MIFFILITLLFTHSYSERLFDRSINDPTDTLEIFALKVEFKREVPDKSLTTGDGTFNSDESDFILDPSGARDKNAYWEQHLEFAQNYYKSVSKNKLHIEYQVFPESAPWVLDKEIIDYNRSTQLEGEKNEELDSVRIDGYLRFIKETITLVDSSDNSPFTQPQSPNRKRVYLIIHAGANRLVDGGSLGTQGADTPSDFFDAYLGPQDFQFYNTIPEYQDDTLGIVVNGGQDTLNQILVLSETASQDDINWGINGILISQIAEALGLPATYDPTEGTTQLGRFDLMDFGGYSSGNGFFPVLPSAWHRIYLGWEDFQTVRMAPSQTTASYTLRPTSQEPGQILKIPINTNEFLLLEYRTRSKDSLIEVTNDKGSVFSVPADSVSQLFLDTLCNAKGQNCRPNSKQASGVFTSAQDYDLTLPGSGVMIWKVNQWLIDETIESGFINRKLTRTSDHYKGLTLVEADGILTLGKEFTNALGQPSFDFGSGKELLPHIIEGTEDTVTIIHPWGYGNTGSTQGGFSHLTLQVQWPESGFLESNLHSFSGDSILNIRSDSLVVELDWGENRIPGSLFPKAISSSTHPQALINVDTLLFTSHDSGTILLSNFQADTLSTIASIPRIFKGSSIHQASDSQFVYSNMTHDRLIVSQWNQSNNRWSSTQNQVLTTGHFQAGPMSYQGVHYWVNDQSLYRLESLSDTPQKLVDLETRVDQLILNPKTQEILLIGRGGIFYQYDLNNDKLSSSTIELPKVTNQPKPQANTQFRGVISDFDLNGVDDLFLISAEGYAIFLEYSTMNLLKGSPQVYARNKENLSSPAVADMNLDGFPEVIFRGDDQLFALDYQNQFLRGFPFAYIQGINEAQIGNTPLVARITGEQHPLILTASPWGLLYAVNEEGKSIQKLPGQESSFACEDQKLNQTGIIKNCGVSWPLNVGPSVQARTPSPMSLTMSQSEGELFISGSQELHSWKFPSTVYGANQWLTEGGNSQRHYYFDASLLNPANAQDQSVIKRFSVFPSPLRHELANFSLETLGQYQSARVRIFDVSGLVVFDQSYEEGQRGLNRMNQVNLNHLASGVYSARVDVHFEGGEKKKAWFRFSAIR